MKEDLFLGIDVGGTKIAGALVTGKGKILARLKIPTPRQASGREITALVIKLCRGLNPAGRNKKISGIGCGIPGIVDTERGRIIGAPNIDLAGQDIAARLKRTFKAKVCLGNDVNCGLLGERWLGAAKGYAHVVGIFPGTGVGGAAIVDGRLLLGSSGAATELGHITIKLNGPRCSCGNHGCLEALAGRWAIERDLRRAVKDGKKTVLTKLSGKTFKTVKSKMLKAALECDDRLVTKIMSRAALAIGAACVSLRHTFDPQIIVLGGGLIEACGWFFLPRIKKAVIGDPFFKNVSHCKVVASRLADDAVILGAVALVKGSSV